MWEGTSMVTSIICKLDIDQYWSSGVLSDHTMKRRTEPALDLNTSSKEWDGDYFMKIDNEE